MKKLVLTLGLASSLLLAAVPAKANGTAFFPWGFVGFEGINFALTQSILVACHGQITTTTQGLGTALIPVYGPLMALNSCPKPKK